MHVLENIFYKYLLDSSKNRCFLSQDEYVWNRVDIDIFQSELHKLLKQ
jgi:hypothetical protein